MRKYFLIILIVFLNCSTDKNPLQFSTPEAGRLYFPLSVGNNWSFCLESMDSNPWMERFVLEEIKINHYKYYIVTDSFKTEDWNQYYYPDTLRIDSKGKVWQLENNQEYLKFDFSLKYGDTYHSKDFLVSVTKVDTVQVPAGEFTNCIRFFFDNPIMFDEETWHTFAPGVGLVKRTAGEGLTIVLDS